MANDQTLDDWRVIPMQGIHNFRDYGGYAGAGGGRLRQGVLFRLRETSAAFW